LSFAETASVAPGRGGNFLSSAMRPPVSDFSQRGDCAFPLLGRNDSMRIRVARATCPCWRATSPPLRQHRTVSACDAPNSAASCRRAQPGWLCHPVQLNRSGGGEGQGEGEPIPDCMQTAEGRTPTGSPGQTERSWYFPQIVVVKMF